MAMAKTQNNFLYIYIYNRSQNGFNSGKLQDVSGCISVVMRHDVIGYQRLHDVQWSGLAINKILARNRDRLIKVLF